MSEKKKQRHSIAPLSGEKKHGKREGAISPISSMRRKKKKTILRENKPQVCFRKEKRM